MKHLKIALDSIMTVLLLLLMNLATTGITLHEWIGLALFLLFFVHKVLNIQWIKAIGSKLFGNKINSKSKFLFVLDALLLLSVTSIIVSGIMISQILFPTLKTNSLAWWSSFHHFSAYFSLVLISVHLGFHWNMILAMVRKLFNLKTVNTARRVVARVLSLLIAAAGIYSLSKPAVNKNFSIPLPNGKDNSATEQSSTPELTEVSITSSSAISQGNLNFAKTSFSQNTFSSDDAALTNYLGNLICTICGRHCPLLSPQCGRGVQYRQQVIDEYYAQNQTSSASSVSSSSSGSDVLSSENSNQTDNSFISSSSAGTTDTTSSVSSSNTGSSDSQSLEDYLGNLFCNVCHKHCSLLAPQCSIGEQKREEETQNYYTNLSNNTNKSDITDSEESTESNSSADTEKKATPFDAIAIMGLVVGSTHYILEIPSEYKRKTKKNK